MIAIAEWSPTPKVSVSRVCFHVSIPPHIPTSFPRFERQDKSNYSRLLSLPRSDPTLRASNRT
jgi:hypothetical protein